MGTVEIPEEGPKPSKNVTLSVETSKTEEVTTKDRPDQQEATSTTTESHEETIIEMKSVKPKNYKVMQNNFFQVGKKPDLEEAVSFTVEQTSADTQTFKIKPKEPTEDKSEI